MYEEDISQVKISSMSEGEFAEYQHHQGIKVIKHQDRYWKETFTGFYQPVHWMSRLTPEQATNPVQTFCWGFQGTLQEKYAAQANGSMPVHLLSNLSDYDLLSLPRKRRNHLRRCQKRTKIVRLTGTKLLRQQGYGVYHSALSRTKHQSPLARDVYQANLISNNESQIYEQNWLLLGGLNDDQLGGYLIGCAIDKTAYIEEINLATEALPTCMGTGLVFEFIQVCRRSSQIKEIVYGLHSREDQALCTFKEGMKFTVTQIPTKVKMHIVPKTLIRLKYPHKYYRLTGQK